jgi:hypothetical protein
MLWDCWGLFCPQCGDKAIADVTTKPSSNDCVMAGLDPAIHHFEKRVFED